VVLSSFRKGGPGLEFTRFEKMDGRPFNIDEVVFDNDRCLAESLIGE